MDWTFLFCFTEISGNVCFKVTFVNDVGWVLFGGLLDELVLSPTERYCCKVDGFFGGGTRWVKVDVGNIIFSLLGRENS